MVEDLEKKRARGREYYHRNKEKIKKQKKEYLSRPAIRERMRKYQRDYQRRKKQKQ